MDTTSCYMRLHLLCFMFHSLNSCIKMISYTKNIYFVISISTLRAYCTAVDPVAVITRSIHRSVGNLHRGVVTFTRPCTTSLSIESSFIAMCPEVASIFATAQLTVTYFVCEAL